MNIAHLELLRELRAHRTLAAVASVTGRSPSAVSQQLRNAERELGIRLVEPAGRGLRLTSAGELLAEGAVGVAAEVERVRARLDELIGVAEGSVRVAALPSAAEVLAPGLLCSLAGGRVQVVLEDADVAEHEFPRLADDMDIVIGHSMGGPVPEGAGRLACVPLLREPLDVALPVANPLAARTAIAAADLAGLEWIGVPEGFPFDAVRIGIEQAAGSALRVTQRIRDNRVVAALVEAGLGLALLPRFSTRPSAGLVLRPLRDVPAARFVVAMCRPDRAERAAVRRVLDVLRQVAAVVPAA